MKQHYKYLQSKQKQNENDERNVNFGFVDLSDDSASEFDQCFANLKENADFKNMDRMANMEPEDDNIAQRDEISDQPNKFLVNYFLHNLICYHNLSITCGSLLFKKVFEEKTIMFTALH